MAWMLPHERDNNPASSTSITSSIKMQPLQSECQYSIEPNKIQLLLPLDISPIECLENEGAPLILTITDVKEYGVRSVTREEKEAASGFETRAHVHVGDLDRKTLPVFNTLIDYCNLSKMPGKSLDLSKPTVTYADADADADYCSYDDESYLDNDVYSEDGLSQSVAPSIGTTHTRRSRASRSNRTPPTSRPIVDPNAFLNLQSQVSELVSLIQSKEKEMGELRSNNKDLTSKLDRLEKSYTKGQDNENQSKLVKFDEPVEVKKRSLKYEDDLEFDDHHSSGDLSYTQGLDAADKSNRGSSDREGGERNFRDDMWKEYESTYDLEEAMISFDHDMFSLMMLHPVQSRDWALALFTIGFQWLYMIIILINLVGLPLLATPFDVPYAVNLEVTIGQFLGVFIVVGLQSDLLSSIRMIAAMSANEEWNFFIVEPEKSKGLFFVRVLLPNIMKFLGGILVLVCNFAIIVSSENIVDLMKDVSAMLIITQITEIVFQLALYGFLGSKFETHAKKAQDMKGIKDVFNTRTGFFSKINPRLSVFIFLSAIMLSTVTVMVLNQKNGVYFKKQYPYCALIGPEINTFANGICDGGVSNTIECAFDGGDCNTYNLQYPNCDAPIPSEIGNNICNEAFNIEDCGFDGGDCCPFGNVNDETELFLDTGNRLVNGQCDGGLYLTRQCKYDNGECNNIRTNTDYTKCDFDDLGNLFDESFSPVLGDKVCESNIYNTEECGYEFGDCEECNNMVANMGFIGDGVCHGGMYNTNSCNQDARDCFEFNEKYPRCAVTAQAVMDERLTYDTNIMQYIPIIGDGICNSGLYNNADCGYEDGDCLLCNEIVDNITKVGDGICDGQNFMSKTCGYDGGDCFECKDENGKYLPSAEIGNGWCTPLYNKPECGWDGGDCMDFNLKYPNCDVPSPSLLGNRFCNGGQYNTEECGWDGGDCIEKLDFRKENPNCDVERPELLGDGVCHGGQYNTELCKFDDGDCLEFNDKYPDCDVEYPSLVGNGWCSFGKYDTLECGWDGGDCLLE